MQRDKTVQDRIHEALLSCRVCELQPVCLPWEMEPEERTLLDRIVEHPQPLQEGEYLFRTGDPLQGIFAVRSGVFKIHQVDGGRERVLGFGLPGELVGVEGVYSQRHVSAAVALVESSACALPYDELAGLLGRNERLRDQILKLASKGTALGLGMAMQQNSAERRIAAFLLDISHRHESHGGSAHRFPFPIREQDMAGHLQLAPREVARIFAHFHSEGLIAGDKRDLSLLDVERLSRIAWQG